MIQQEAFKPFWVSVAVLAPPSIASGKLRRGILILNQVDHVIELFPGLRSMFIIVERRGWHGINRSYLADIKLVEDLSTIDATREKFPNAVLVPLGPADFVDTNVFRPLSRIPDFDCIQISCWSRRKRIELLIEAAALLPKRRFLHLGHLEDNGSAEEFSYRESCLSLAARIAPNIHFAYAHVQHNDKFPTGKHAINDWINRARIGILTTQSEGINRFKMECLAANRPVLIPNDVGSTTSKHICATTGRSYTPSPSDLAETIEAVLTNLHGFRPRDYLPENTGQNVAVRCLKAAVRDVCERHGDPYVFDHIEWDGRNESLKWGEDAFALLRKLENQFAPNIPMSQRT